MSIKDLFNSKVSYFENATTGSKKVESVDYILRKIDQQETFIPFINFETASNFAKFGSAHLYYTKAIERIYDNYPYDGSDKEKVLFDLSSSYLDKWIFDNHYPKTTGYINMSYGGWGSVSSTANGYGLPASVEYIYARGGMHTASSGMAGIPLYKTFGNSTVYDSAANRATTFKMNMTNGFTVEFWLKKDGFDLTKTNKEVILDLWNGEATSSNDYGRFTLELSGTGIAETGTNTFRVTLQSGTVGFFDQYIGASTVTTSSLENWQHYAFSFVSGANYITSRMYVNGDLSEEKNIGTSGFTNIGGLINGYIGALQTAPSGTAAVQYAGKLSASLDDFRFWKSRRTSEQIYDNWYVPVGGGTNTDDANVELGLYYKFNEGVVGTDSTDSVVLDYSGRIANGTWIGYSAGARNTGSAFVSSSLISHEPHDPIIRSVHPDVVTLKSNLQASGSNWDEKNPTYLYRNSVHSWMQDEDEDAGSHLKFIYQIISSYFDTLYAQITALTSIKDKTFPDAKYKPYSFAKQLLENKGIIVNDILIDSNLFEKFNSRDENKIVFEKNTREIKDLIYTNIYNNIDEIQKAKGTEKSIRNMLRCFGIDDEIVKLNVYTDEGTHYFKDKVRHTSINKKYINFYDTNNFEGTIFQTSSLSNANTFITGSEDEKNEIYSAITYETELFVPKKLGVYDKGYFLTPFTESSLFGVHQTHTNIGDYTWDTSDTSHFRVSLIREDSHSKKAKIQITGSFLYLTSSYINDVYDNELWNMAVRIRPTLYPIIGNVVTSSSPTYILDFYGVTHVYETKKKEVHLTASLSNVSGTAFMTKSKRFFIGAHRENFTGSTLQKCDVKIGGARIYLDYIDNGTIAQHNLDPTNYGSRKSYQSPTLFSNKLNLQVPSSELLSLHWSFGTNTGSDSSGEFIIDDVSSGSSVASYGWMDNIIKTENRGRGYGFPASNTSIAKNEVIFASKKQLPEMAYTSNNISIDDDEKNFFIKDEDVSDNFFSLEKSMSQVISDEMLRMFASVKEFNNLIGKAVDRYRAEYKNLNLLRRIFFDNVQEDPDFDKFTRYFKWIDSSISTMISNLYPMSARNSGQISDVVESHILERNKYQNKFPLLVRHSSTGAPIKGAGEHLYNWKHGHAPINDDEKTNCFWKKEREIRTDLPQREEIRKIINTQTSGNAPHFAQRNTTVYEGSAYVIRKMSRPYKLSVGLPKTIHGGINYEINKDRDMIYNMTSRHGQVDLHGIPQNVVVVGVGSGSGVVEKAICDDAKGPNIKKRHNLTAFVGKYSDGSVVPKPYGGQDYEYIIKENKLPINIVSSSLLSGYNIHNATYWKSASVITNVHSDTTSPTNHIPMQGPFTETWVGGHQSRHIKLNKYDTSLVDGDVGGPTPNNLDNEYTRPEAWRMLFKDRYAEDGAFGFVGPDYGGPYPDKSRKVAVHYREERAKRPVNIRNIQYSTASQRIGNFKETYEVLSVGSSKANNNFYLRKNPAQTNYLPSPFPAKLTASTTHVMSLFGQAPFVSGNVFGVHDNNRQPDKTELVVVPSVTGFYSSGSFKIKGRDNVKDGDYIDINEAGPSFASKRFIVNGADSSEVYGISTGSSDTVFWNNFTHSISVAFTSSYSTNLSTTDLVTGSSIWRTASGINPSVISSSTISPELYNVDEFTFAAWVYYSGSSTGDFQILDTISDSGSEGSGNQGLEIYVDGDGKLRFRISRYNVSDGSSGTTSQWIYNHFESNYANKWVHVAFTHNSASNPDSASVYFNAVSGVWSGHACNFAGGCPSDYSDLQRHSPINKIFIGNSAGASFNPGTKNQSQWYGGFSEAMWFNKELDIGAVEDLYNCREKLPYLLGSAALPSSSHAKSWWTFGDHISDKGHTYGTKFGIQVSESNQITDVLGNTNLFVDNKPQRMFWSGGVPQSASAAVISLTASTQTSNLNASLVSSSACSFEDLVQVAGGQAPVQGDIRKAYDVVLPLANNLLSGKRNKTVISSRFSAPGGIEVQSPGYLDIYSREYSVHNALPFRNLTVRGSGSGEDGTIRALDHLQNRSGLQTLMRRHCGKAGSDSTFGSITSTEYVTLPSFHKIQRNTSRRIEEESSLSAPSFIKRHDNGFVTSPIPRSEFQYSWITASLGSNYSISSGQQTIYGYAPANGMLRFQSDTVVVQIASSLGSSNHGKKIILSDGYLTRTFAFHDPSQPPVLFALNVIGSTDQDELLERFYEAILKNTRFKLNIFKITQTDTLLKSLYGVSPDGPALVIASRTNRNISVSRTSTTNHWVSNITIHETNTNEAEAITFPSGSEIHGV